MVATGRERVAMVTRTTIKDIARAAGCSYTTVSHALNGTRYVAPETRERIAELARTMGYRPDPVARALKGQDSLLVGHILCGLHDNPFFSLVARGADQRAQELGYATLLSYTDHHAEAEERAVRLLLEKRVDGIIFTTPLSPANVELAVAAGAAAVMVERPLPVRGAHAVVVDHRGGVRDLTRLLIEGGHRRLAYIGGDLSLEGSASVERERLNGFRDVVDAAGLAVPPAHVRLVPYGVEPARAACVAVLDAPLRPTALVVASDLLAAGVLQVLYERGLRVPDDVSVVGLDDTLGPYMAPPLTEAEPQTVEMGRQAVDFIVEQCRGATEEGGNRDGRRVTLTPRLHIRASTRAIAIPGAHALV